MYRALWNSFVVARRFRGYKPQPVTPLSFIRWLRQIPGRKERDLAITLLRSVIYLNERSVRDTLIQQNEQLLKRLSDAGIPAQKVIYVQTDDAGSSSPVMLNLLRNEARLVKRGCKLVDSHHALQLRDLTDQIGDGAIVYVDDFIGTGVQFEETRSIVGPCIVGNFAEFLLSPVICEEGIVHLGKIGVEPVTEFIHRKAERPLYGYSNFFNAQDRAKLLEITKSFSNGCYYDGLGYKRCATMFVLYSNAPDTLPRIFRGSPDQIPKRGIFPRFDDLPVLS